VTELERQLAGALQALSEQYEREQKRQAERIETLLRQVRALEGQVQALAADYRRLAALLRRRSRG